MLMSELITELTHMMESTGNYVVKLTEDGTEALHLTSISHVVKDDEHAFVLSSSHKVEDAVESVHDTDPNADPMSEIEESETQKETDDAAKSDKPNVTDDAGKSSP